MFVHASEELLSHGYDAHRFQIIVNCHDWYLIALALKSFDFTSKTAIS